MWCKVSQHHPSWSVLLQVKVIRNSEDCFPTSFDNYLLHIYIYDYIYIWLYVYIYIYDNMYIYMIICVYIYIYLCSYVSTLCTWMPRCDSAYLGRSEDCSNSLYRCQSKKVQKKQGQPGSHLGAGPNPNDPQSLSHSLVSNNLLSFGRKTILAVCGQSAATDMKYANSTFLPFRILQRLQNWTAVFFLLT